MKLALWVSWCHWPFAIVEDDELIDIFMDLNNKVEVPSRSTVSRDVKEIFHISHAHVASMLQVCHVHHYHHFLTKHPQAYPDKVHICLDGWTSPQVIAFIGTMVHWVVNSCMQSLILDFIKWVHMLHLTAEMLTTLAKGHRRLTQALILRAECLSVYTDMASTARSLQYPLLCKVTLIVNS
jgi:hypothetical protein